MNVLFVWPHEGTIGLPLGIAYLSASLKARGHRTALYDATWGYKESQFLATVRSFQPDLLAFSVTSPGYKLALSIAKKFKEHSNSPVVFGGVHPTLAPEEVIAEPAVDFVCVGEGEDALGELVTRLENGGDVTSVRNFLAKTSTGFVKNDVGLWNDDLDSLPFPDRELFDEQHRWANFPGITILTTRGCPFNCTYCANNALRKPYAGKGTYVRSRSVQNVVDEMKLVVEQYDPKSLYIVDDMFTVSKDRVLRFCEEYRRRVGIPFRCLARTETVDQEMLSSLKEAGCVSIHFGIESGSDKIRREYLNRKMSRESIVRAFQTAKEVGLKTASYNMIGLPWETYDDVMATLELNRECRPNLVQVTILYPFVGTDARDLYHKEGWLKSDESVASVYSEAATSLPDLSSKQLLLLETMFPVWYYFGRKGLLPGVFEAFTKLSLSIGSRFMLRLVGALGYRISRLSPIYDAYAAVPRRPAGRRAGASLHPSDKHGFGYTRRRAQHIWSWLTRG